MGNAKLPVMPSKAVIAVALVSTSLILFTASGFVSYMKSDETFIFQPVAKVYGMTATDINYKNELEAGFWYVKTTETKTEIAGSFSEQGRRRTTRQNPQTYRTCDGSEDKDIALSKHNLFISGVQGLYGDDDNPPDPQHDASDISLLANSPCQSRRCEQGRGLWISIYLLVVCTLIYAVCNLQFIKQPLTRVCCTCPDVGNARWFICGGVALGAIALFALILAHMVLATEHPQGPRTVSDFNPKSLVDLYEPGSIESRANDKHRNCWTEFGYKFEKPVEYELDREAIDAWMNRQWDDDDDDTIRRRRTAEVQRQRRQPGREETTSTSKPRFIKDFIKDYDSNVKFASGFWLIVVGGVLWLVALGFLMVPGTVHGDGLKESFL